MQSFLHTLVLLGALQGFISAILLLSAKGGKLPYKLLAVLILVIALANLNVFLLYQSLSPFWLLIGDIFPLLLFMAVGPLIFLYTRASIDHPYRMGKKDTLLFLPVILDLVPYALGSFYHAGLINEPYTFIDQYNIYVDIPRWISLTIYCALSVKMIRGTNTPLANNAKQLILAFGVFQLIWLLFLGIYLLPGYRDSLLNMAGWFPLYIPLTALIYWIGIKGFLSLRTAYADRKRPAATSIVSAESAENALTRLRHLMETDKLYLDPSLNLAKVAAKANLPQKVISSVLNQHLNSSFNEFVNGYRVDAFKQKVNDPAMQVYSIKGLALECGFNSLATFQRVFKQVTGLSPSDFRRNGA
jgi:AraC-like DNA-binding protein